MREFKYIFPEGFPLANQARSILNPIVNYEADGEIETETEGDTDGDAEGDAEGDEETETEEDTEGDRDTETEGDTDGLLESDTDGDIETDTDGLLETDTEGDIDGLNEPEVMLTEWAIATYTIAYQYVPSLVSSMVSPTRAKVERSFMYFTPPACQDGSNSELMSDVIVFPITVASPPLVAMT